MFLCTGNYYRSRFAELLFNHLAAEKSVDWKATSRGLALERGAHNVGPIAQDTLKALLRLGVPVETGFRYPLPVDVEDLALASHIVAVKQEEHLPLLERRFPDWANRVEFWQVHDRDLAPPPEALAQIDRHVRELIQRLRMTDQAR